MIVDSVLKLLLALPVLKLSLVLPVLKLSLVPHVMVTMSVPPETKIWIHIHNKLVLLLTLYEFYTNKHYCMSIVVLLPIIFYELLLTYC